uniref:Uncharacterized protein n=1 Tax=Caenorhabditis japonica TaxID=281687 RepID=A0A8R1HVY2_CAEJA
MGAFKLYGMVDEIFKIEPFISINHTCNAKPGCEHISEYVVPKDKIGGTYDMAYIALENNVANDAVNCR